MTTSLRVFLIIACGLVFSTSSVAIGQSSVAKDPLKKPSIWKQLQTYPKNDNLWKSYFGKDLFELNAAEGKNYRLWRSFLIAEKHKQEEIARKKMMAIYHTKTSYIAKSPYLQRLMSNVKMNFMLIEDFFDEEFENNGETYEFYEDKFPDGKFSKIMWIAQNEKKLIELTKK
ncbi:MAG: hypothetical protein ACI85I_000417 [Arenicella sp.]|jgi:hypothetical protein